MSNLNGELNWEPVNRILNQSLALHGISQ